MTIVTLPQYGERSEADLLIGTDHKNVEVIMIENSQSYQKEYVLHHVEGGLYATDIMIPFSGSWEINAVIEDSQMYRTENWLVHVYTYHQYFEMSI